MKKTALFLLLITCFIACKNKENNSITDQSEKEEQVQKNNKAEEYLKEVSITHQTEEYNSHKAIRFQTVSTLDKPALRVSLSTNLNGFKIQTEDSKFLYFDGNKLYSSEKKLPEDLLNYMLSTVYYFSLPYHLENLTAEVLNHKSTDRLLNSEFSSLTLKLKENILQQTTEEIKVFSAPKTSFLTAVEFSQSSKNPPILVYQNYFSIGKIIIAKYWEFYDAAEEENPVLTEKITLSGVNFFTPQKDFFKIPENTYKINFSH